MKKRIRLIFLMKILLINAKNALKEGITHLPLVLAYPAAVLEDNGFSVSVIDLAVEGLSNEELSKRVEGIEPDLFVINSETTVLQVRNYCHALDLSVYLNDNFPKISIAMMGAHVTFRDKETMVRNRHIKFIIRHEAELVLLNLVKTLELGEDLNSVNGLTFRGDNIIRNSDEKPIDDLDSLPFPARHLFPIEKYLKKDYETVIQGSRGCANKCYFCHSSTMDRTLRFRNISSVVDEIKEVLALGFQSIYFTDYDFGISQSRVEEFCQKIIDEKIDFSWNCNIRADRFSDEKKANILLKLMKKAGCNRLFVGFESISGDILKKSNKKVTPNQLYRAASIIKNNGINLHASFLFGLPEDTEETINATVEFAKQIDPQMVSFNILTPYPGTPFGDNPEKFGILMNDQYWYEKKDNLKRNVAGNRNLSSEKLYQLANKAYQDFLSDKFDSQSNL